MTSRTRAAGHGFTLIEILLVVAIALIVTGLAIPAFVRSYQAANLRSAARSVVTAGKYARNMAVLQQRQMTVFFDSNAGRIDIVALERASGPPLDAFLDGRRGITGGNESFTTDVRRSVELPEQVRIQNFSAPSASQSLDGIYWINYFPSGISDSFSLRIVHQNQRRSVTIEVDHLSGTTTVTHE